LALTLLELGAQANAACERRHGNLAYFSLLPVNLHRIHCSPADLPAALAQVPAGTRAVTISIAAPSGATTGEAEIRAIAEARLALPQVDHIAADWIALTPYVAQVALRFGASLITGIPLNTPRAEVERLLTEAGRSAIALVPELP
jgi:hypothetical protein